MIQTYNPQQDLLTGIRGMEPLEMFPWDDYYPRMAQTDFFVGQAETMAVKTAFYRTAPFGGSFVILGGLTAFLRQLHDYRFTDEVCKGMLDMGYKKQYVEFLKRSERIRLKVFSNPEGSVYLGNEPAISFVGSIHDLRIAEGMLLKNTNFPSLLMTQWNRIVRAAYPCDVLEFARRRAQNANLVSLYSYLAGAKGTSNAEIRRWFLIPVFGTMGHEWMMFYGDDLEAFLVWLEYNPDRATLLLDTVNTLQSGVPAAIKAFKIPWRKIMEAGGKPAGRNDSGDLAWLSGAELKEYGLAGIGQINILNTNDLDEHTITKIKWQILQNSSEFGVPSDRAINQLVWAVGTKGGTCYDQPALGGVMKLQEVNGVARMKISDVPAKTNLPGFNQSFFVWRGKEFICSLVCPAKNYQVKAGRLLRDGVALKEIEAIHPDDGSKRMVLGADCVFEKRQQLIYDGEDFAADYIHPTLDSVKALVKKETGRLDWSYLRSEKSHVMKLSVVPELFDLRQEMIQQRILRADRLK
jgi:nicotinate phosphoribosyltransferase